MATKGPSGKFSKTNGSRGNVSSIHYQWARAFNKNTLDKHFKKHGSQMDASNKQEYESRAVHFANQIDKKNFKYYSDVYKTYKYDKKRNILAIIDKNGIVISFYKPKNGFTLESKKGKQKWQVKKNK